MEDWVREAKELARTEAGHIIDELRSVADENNLDRVWFIEEVVANINKLKKSEYM